MTNLDPQATLRRATAATMASTLHSSMDEAAFRRYNSSEYPSSGASGVPTTSRLSQNGGGGSSGSRRRSSGGSQGDDRGGERGSTRAGTSGSVASRSQPNSTAATVLNRRSSADDPRQWQLQRQLDQRNPPAVSSSTANGGMARSRSMAASLAQQRDAILNSLNFADNGQGSGESGSGGSRGNAGFFAQSGGTSGSGGTASSSGAARSGRAMLSRGGDGGGQRAVSSSSSNAQDMPRAARSLNDIMSNMRLGGGGGGGGSGG